MSICKLYPQFLRLDPGSASSFDAAQDSLSGMTNKKLVFANSAIPLIFILFNFSYRADSFSSFGRRPEALF